MGVWLGDGEGLRAEFGTGVENGYGGKVGDGEGGMHLGGQEVWRFGMDWGWWALRLRFC